MRPLVFVAAVLSAACGADPPPLASAYPSAEALGRQVVAALTRGDEARLAMLAMSEDEFRVHVWPELPASRPERNLPFSYVWGDLHQKSTASLHRLVASHRGRHLELVGVAFEGETTDYGSFQVHRDSVFSVREAGALGPLRACGSLIVKDGQWKVFSYVIDE